MIKAQEVLPGPDSSRGPKSPNRLGRLPPEAKVFDFLVNIDRGVRKKVPLGRFKAELRERCKEDYPEAILPDDSALELVYERLVDARVDMLWVIVARKLSKSEAWKRYRKWTRTTGELTSRLTAVLRSGIPGFLSPSQGKIVRSLSVLARRLTTNLSGLERFDRRLEEIAKGHNRNSTLRNARLRLERLLVKKSPSLTREQRAVLIATATELAGLRKGQTEEAVMRSINRSGLAAKRLEAGRNSG